LKNLVLYSNIGDTNFIPMGRAAKKLILSDDEKAELNSIVKSGTHKSRKIIRAKALLLMDAGKNGLTVRNELNIDEPHYYRIKRRYFEGGLPTALNELSRSGQPPIVTPRLEAQITSLACSDAPPGCARWTLSLLNDKIVELKYIESISDESIRQVLKKVNSSLGSKKCGVLAP
jgi:putative transposase